MWGGDVYATPHYFGSVHKRFLLLFRCHAVHNSEHVLDRTKLSGSESGSGFAFVWSAVADGAPVIRPFLTEPPFKHAL